MRLAASPSTQKLLIKASLLVLACVLLIPLYRSTAQGPCVPHLSFSPAILSAHADGSVAVDIQVENIGTGSCSAGYLSLYYPDGLEYVMATPAPKAGTYFWSFAGLPSGQVQTIHLGLQVDPGSILPMELSGALNAGDQDVESSVLVMAVEDPTASPEPSLAAVTTSSGSVLCHPMEEKGMWIWNTPRGMSEAWRTKVLENMAAHGFNMAYIDGSELPVLNTEAEPTRSSDLAAFNTGLSAFVRDAQARGIGVQVTFGYRDWGEPQNRSKPLSIVDHVLSYNAGVSDSERVCGVQSDIESYLMESYEGAKETVLGNYLETMDQITKKVAASGSGMSIGIVIPHFYDPVQAWTPPITRNGVTQSAYEHVLDILSQVKRGSVSIMAYRNFLVGDNGVIDLVTPELRIAQEKHSQARVIIAQEVGCGLDPAWVSWCGSSKSLLETALSQLRLTFFSSPALGGFAVNYIDPYINLAD